MLFCLLRGVSLIDFLSKFITKVAIHYYLITDGVLAGYLPVNLHFELAFFDVMLYNFRPLLCYFAF